MEYAFLWLDHLPVWFFFSFCHCSHAKTMLFIVSRWILLSNQKGITLRTYYRTINMSKIRSPFTGISFNKYALRLSLQLSLTWLFVLRRRRRWLLLLNGGWCWASFVMNIGTMEGGRCDQIFIISVCVKLKRLSMKNPAVCISSFGFWIYFSLSLSSDSSAHLRVASSIAGSVTVLFWFFFRGGTWCDTFTAFEFPLISLPQGNLVAIQWKQ